MFDSKCFLSSKSGMISEGYSSNAENTDLLTGIYYILQYIHIENRYLKL